MAEVVTAEEVNAERGFAEEKIKHLRSMLETVNSPNLEDIKNAD
jgi:hypothetical protein